MAVPGLLGVRLAVPRSWAAAAMIVSCGCLVPLPDRDFDVTEVAVPWRILGDAGHQVVFATGRPGVLPAADPRLLAGVILGGCVGQQI